ncbi:hypothetical protein EMIT0111MI5_100156 [Burkholderia sp. IT-111MI5]
MPAGRLHTAHRAGRQRHPDADRPRRGRDGLCVRAGKRIADLPAHGPARRARRTREPLRHRVRVRRRGSGTVARRRTVPRGRARGGRRTGLTGRRASDTGRARQAIERRDSRRRPANGFRPPSNRPFSRCNAPGSVIAPANDPLKR